MLEKIIKPYRYSILGVSLVNLILCLCSYGYKEWYKVYYSKDYLWDYVKDGRYNAKLIDVSTIGSIFFICCCALLVLGAAIIFLQKVKEYNNKYLNIAFSGFSIFTGILGVIAQAEGKSYILANRSLTELSDFRYVQSFFTDKYILSLVLMLSILMIIYSAIELAYFFISSKKNTNNGVYTVEL